jgi:hypothetical protein
MPAYEYTSFVIPDSRSSETKVAIDQHLSERATAGWTLDNYSMAVRTDQGASSASTHTVIHAFIWIKQV